MPFSWRNGAGQRAQNLAVVADDRHLGAVHDARFSGGRVDFSHAQFSGSWVTFTGAQFSGGEVTFSNAGDWSSPPAFPWTDTPPTGVKLP
jgi:hypothetical protein